MTSPYTTNIAQNPGLQLGLSGYAGLNNATLIQSAIGTGGTLFGNPGLLVTTPGAISGEGVITPASTVQVTANHSASIYIQGTILPGSVTIYVVSNPGGVILGSAPVTLTDAYQRVVVNNFPAVASNTLSIVVSTTSMETVQFWITNVQIEADATSHPYCDGGQPGCAWVSTVGGASLQQYQNTIEAVSNIVDGASIVYALIKGEIFNAITSGASDRDRSALVTTVTAPGPAGALTDFAVYSLTDPDPAQTYTSWNNTGASVPTSGYVRSFGIFYPPQDYFVSGGSKLYSRAAYMAAGWQFSGMPNNQKVILTDAQVEVLPVTTGFSAASPSTYNVPRSIDTIIKPNRLNYCPNPSFETSIAGWTPVGSGVLTQDATTSVGEIIQLDDQVASTGNSSLNVATTNPSGDGASIQITNLIAGDTYIVSAYVQADANVADILMSCVNGATSVVHGNSGTGYDVGGYGSGFYGGNPPVGGSDFYGSGLYGTGLFGLSIISSSIPVQQWFRIYTTFQPTDSVATLQFTAVTSSATDFWIDAVLVEPGEVLGFYFDGDFGVNYFWETGGTPGLTRSYFYDEYFVKSQAVLNVLGHHTPYGISFTAPQYFIPPTQ